MLHLKPAPIQPRPRYWRYKPSLEPKAQGKPFNVLTPYNQKQRKSSFHWSYSTTRNMTVSNKFFDQDSEDKFHEKEDLYKKAFSNI